MQDHAYETRQMYIKDYAERVKLQPDEQRAMWMDYLKLIKHPRMEPITRREPLQERAIVAALWNSKQEQEKERTMREFWKEL